MSIFPILRQSPILLLLALVVCAQSGQADDKTWRSCGDFLSTPYDSEARLKAFQFGLSLGQRPKLGDLVSGLELYAYGPQVKAELDTLAGALKQSLASQFAGRGHFEVQIRVGGDDVKLSALRVAEASGHVLPVTLKNQNFKLSRIAAGYLLQLGQVGDRSRQYKIPQMDGLEIGWDRSFFVTSQARVVTLTMMVSDLKDAIPQYLELRSQGGEMGDVVMDELVLASAFRRFALRQSGLRTPSFEERRFDFLASEKKRLDEEALRVRESLKALVMADPGLTMSDWDMPNFSKRQIMEDKGREKLQTQERAVELDRQLILSEIGSM